MILSAITTAAFVLLMWLIAFKYRRHPSPDEFFIANRRAAPVTVGAALFQLIGGGEIVTITSLAWANGFSAISLFLGYSAAFFVIGLLARRIRRRAELANYYSLPDYIYDVYGIGAGRIVAVVSIVAFFALMLLQFSAAGQLLAPLIGLKYETAVVLMAVIPVTYLVLGGFRTVLATDLLQGAVMFALSGFLACYLGYHYGLRVSSPQIAAMPVFSSLSMILTGFFVALASSDVWQRAFAARTDRAARLGFFQGATWLLLGGFILCWMGVLARQLGVAENADAAFGSLMANTLPAPLQSLVALLMFVALISTADTEMFLLSSLLQREYCRATLTHSGGLDGANSTVNRGRGLLVAISISGMLIALAWRDLIQLYTWLLSALLVVSPVVIVSLFSHVGRKTAFWALVLNALLFIGLAFLNALTLENAFLIVLPGGVALAFGALLEKSQHGAHH